MTLRRLELLQWFGLLGAAGAWVGEHLIGFGVTQADCNVAGARWGLNNDLWQLVVMLVAAAVIVGAEVAAVAVFRRTRAAHYEGDPPLARMQFFAIAAIVANVLFLVIVLLDGVGSIAGVGCRQA